MQLFKIPDSLKFHPPFDNRMSFTKEMQIKAKCFKKWCVLLLGKKVTIAINYNPLELLSNYTQHHKKHISTAALTVVWVRGNNIWNQSQDDKTDLLFHLNSTYEHVAWNLWNIEIY